MSSKNEKKVTFISELKRDGRINEDVLNVVSDLTIEELGFFLIASEGFSFISIF